MELKHLRTLLAIRERRSFTKAAGDLGITQAAVSQHVAQLEAELGLRLFDRRARQVELTDAGRQLCQYADRILQLVDDATANLRGTAAQVAGVLHIAASTVPSATVLPKLLGPFQQSFPQVRSEVHVSESRTAAAAVENGEADVGFVGDEPTSKKLHCVPIAEDELSLVVSTDHELVQRERIALKQLANIPLIVREANSGTRRCLEAALAQRDMTLDDLNVAMEVNSNDAITAAVRGGAGAAFLSTATVRDEIESGRVAVLKVRSLRPRRQLYLIHARGGDGRQPLRAFLEFVKDASG